MATIDDLNTQVAGLSTNVANLLTAVNVQKSYIDGAEALAAAQVTLATTQVALATTQANNAAASYDSFDDRYLGAKALAPTLDNDGNALLTGALYFNTAVNSWNAWNGTTWVAAPAAIAAASTVSNTPAGNIAATTVQAAINELDAEKQAITSKDASGGYAGLTLFKINFMNALGTFKSFFTNSNTAARTYTFQDRDGTIADNTDLALKADIAGSAFTGPTSVDYSPTATTAQFAVRGPSGSLSREGKFRFFGTFGSGTDTGNRLISSLRSGFNAGVWGTEYLDIWLNNASNDAFSDANQAKIARFTINGLDITTGQLKEAGSRVWTVSTLGAAGGAAAVGNTPAGNISATTVQAALNELDTEKAKINGDGTQDFAVKSLNGGPLAGMRNRIINGDMRIDQRNLGASVSLGTNNSLLDRYQYFASIASKFNMQQNAGSVTPPTGFTHYMGFTVSAAVAVATTDYFEFVQKIEGLNVSDYAWGTASAQSITLSFQARSSITGTHSGAIQNGDATRTYPFTYTISAANTWEYKTITIPGDTSGTWLKDTGIGMYVIWNLGAGSSNLKTAATWAAGGCVGATGSVSIVGALGATFYITGVQVELGSIATPFERRFYAEEMRLCQRYLPSVGSESTVGQCITATSGYVPLKYPVAVRVPATGITTGTVGSMSVSAANASSVALTSLSFTSSGINGGVVQFGVASGLVAGNATLFTTSGQQLYFTGCEL